MASQQHAGINIDYKGNNYKLNSQQLVLPKVEELMKGIRKGTIDDSAEIIINMSTASTARESFCSS